MSFTTRCFCFLFSLYLSEGMAQSRKDPIEVVSQKNTDVSHSGLSIHKYVGNVKLRHSGVLLFCDQAVRNSTTSQIEAHGHVLMVVGDSITVRGDSMVYTGNDRQAIVRGRVMFQNRDVVLTTTRLDYNISSGVAHFADRSRLVDGKTLKISREGNYNSRTRQFTGQPENLLATTGMPSPVDPYTKMGGRDVGIQLNTVFEPANENSTAESRVPAPAVLQKAAPKLSPGTTKGNVLTKAGRRDADAVESPAPKVWVFDKPVVVGHSPEPDEVDEALEADEPVTLPIQPTKSRPVAVGLPQPKAGIDKAAKLTKPVAAVRPDSVDAIKQANFVIPAASADAGKANTPQAVLSVNTASAVLPTQTKQVSKTPVKRAVVKSVPAAGVSKPAVAVEEESDLERELNQKKRSN